MKSSVVDESAWCGFRSGLIVEGGDLFIKQLVREAGRRLFNIELAPPFAASTLLRRLSTRFRRVSMGMFDHSSRSAFVRSGTDVG